MSNETLILKSAVATNSDIAITDLPFANVDALEGAKHFQNESFEGVKTFKSAKTGATAFGTATVKGDEVPIVIGSSEIYDEQFKYGVYADGQIKTADEIFAPDQDGNYDISDYSAIPATTLLERIGTFPAGSNNTIRINKDTAAKYVEGFRTENLLNEEYFNGTINGVDVEYHNGVFNFNGTSTDTEGQTNALYKKFFTLPAGTYNYRIHWISEQIANRLDVAVSLATSNDSAIISITNEGNKTFTLQEETVVYVGVSLLEIKNYDISFQIIISKRNVNNNYIHPIEKLDYVVAQANAKGYDVTVANNENDVKLIEKVKFSKTEGGSLKREYIDTGIDVNGSNSDSVYMKTEVQPIVSSHSMYLISAFNNTSNGIGLYLYKAQDAYKFYHMSGTAIKRTYNPTFNLVFILLRNVYEIKQSELYINNIKNNMSSVPTSYTISSDTTILLGMKDITQSSNSTYFDGYMFNAIINDNTFIPANNGTTDGIVNLKDMSFHPLISIN